MKQCVKCQIEIEGKYVRYCDPCRSLQRRKRVKYVPTEFIDSKLKQIYALRPDRRSSPIPSMAQVSKAVGWPKWALKKRAQKLGLTRNTDDRPWTQRELEICERYAWMSDERIRLKLKASGFTRTCTAIHLKVKRLGLKQSTGHYTARNLADCFGIDSHSITRWIESGKLKAIRRETERTEKQGGDMWLITHENVKEFVLSHPLEFDIRKVEQLWFMDLVANGKIGQERKTA